VTATILFLDLLLLACWALARRMARSEPARPVAPPSPPSAASPIPPAWVAPGWMLLAGPAEALRIVRDRRATYRIERVA